MITVPFFLILAITPISLVAIRRADRNALRWLALLALVLAIWALRIWDAQVRLEMGVERFNAQTALGLEPGPPGGGAARIFAVYFGWLQALVWIALNGLVIFAVSAGLRLTRRDSSPRL